MFPDENLIHFYDNIHSLSFCIPELLLLGGIIFLFFLKPSGIEKKSYGRGLLALIFTGTAFFFSCSAFIRHFFSFSSQNGNVNFYQSILENFSFSQEFFLFNHYFLLNFFTQGGEVLILFIMLWVFLVNLFKNPPFMRIHGISEILILFIGWGAILLIAAENFLSIFLALEIISLPLLLFRLFPALIQKKPQEIREGLHTLFLGAAASGLLLFGMSLLYGKTGTMQCREIKFFLEENQSEFFFLSLALGLSLSGFFLKLFKTPSVLWKKETFQEFPLSLLLYLAWVPKLAGLILILRLF